MRKNSTTNPPNIFDCIRFEKVTDDSTYMLHIEPLNFRNQNILWNYIQRDILLSLVKEHFTIVHLDKLLCKTMSLNQLDNEIGKLYPVFQNNNGDYFIEIPPNDIRLLTEIINTDLIWESGNLLHIAIFKEKPIFSDNNITFENAEVVMHSFYDNLGFYIDTHNMSLYDNSVKDTIKSILDGYHTK